ncbi:MAG: hypothetical protein KY463_00265, partial [Actinobacteria bacterium]|nr:hypothetical protein [Actinomycetota bacterium]
MAFCDVDALEQIYGRLSTLAGRALPRPPTHVTLYTAQPEMDGIGLGTQRLGPRSREVLPHECRHPAQRARTCCQPGGVLQGVPLRVLPREHDLGQPDAQGLVGVDRACRGDERLPGDLAAEHPLTVLVGLAPPEDVHLDGLEVEEVDELVELGLLEGAGGAGDDAALGVEGHEERERRQAEGGP